MKSKLRLCLQMEEANMSFLEEPNSGVDLTCDICGSKPEATASKSLQAVSASAGTFLRCLAAVVVSLGWGHLTLVASS